jgi:hypothetical protein
LLQYNPEIVKISGLRMYLFSFKKPEEDSVRKYYFFFFFSLAIIFIGCPTRSLQPLFNEKDLLFNPLLVGSWKEGETTYTFQQSTDKNYRVVIRSESEPDSFVYSVKLGKIGSSWFLDSYPSVNSEEHHYLSAHIFTRMTLQGDSLRLGSLENDWLSKKIEKGEIKIPHVERDGDIVLTASTSELQQLIRKIGEINEAFPNENKFVRLK